MLMNYRKYLKLALMLTVIVAAAPSLVNGAEQVVLGEYFTQQG